jgi:D-tyrosyl-tRNA(Tyr) deacylase
MRLVIQRVIKASAKIEKQIIGQIGKGMVVFLGIKNDDSEKDIQSLVKKLPEMRIFENKDNKFDLSLLDIGGEILIIPQFTLFADCSKGNRPYFGEAARPEIAKPLFEKFVVELKKSGFKVEKGEFGAKMEIEAISDGPVTIIIDSNKLE